MKGRQTKKGEIHGERWGEVKGCFAFVDRSCLVLKKSIFVDCLHLASFRGCGKVAPPSPLTHTSSCQKRTGWHRGKGRPRKKKQEHHLREEWKAICKDACPIKLDKQGMVFLKRCSHCLGFAFVSSRTAVSYVRRPARACEPQEKHVAPWPSQPCAPHCDD